jgi:outer membrane lipoprotein SlyB
VRLYINNSVTINPTLSRMDRRQLNLVPKMVVVALIGVSLTASACSDQTSTSTTSTSQTSQSSSVSSGDLVTVPNVAGEPMDQAVASIQSAGLAPGGIYVDPSGPKTSVVISTTPAAGSRVPAGTKVVFNIGSGN